MQSHLPVVINWLEDAVKEAKADAEERKQQRWAFTMEIIDGLRPFNQPSEKAAKNLGLLYDPALVESRGETVTPARIRYARDYLTALADAMEIKK